MGWTSSSKSFPQEPKRYFQFDGGRTWQINELVGWLQRLFLNAEVKVSGALAMLFWRRIMLTLLTGVRAGGGSGSRWHQRSL